MQMTGPPAIITPPSSYSALIPSQNTEHENNICSIVLPYLLIWDPLHQFPLHFRNSIPCIQCGSALVVDSWKYGQTNALQPRVIHCLYHTVLLVSVVYMCENGHEVPSTDPRILQMLKVEEHVPFILLHKSGFTRDFVHTILLLYIQGMPLKSIETYVRECRLQMCKSKLDCLQNELKLSSSTLSIHVDMESGVNLQPFHLLRCPLPSNDILGKCFHVHFQQCKSAYEANMASLTAKHLISFNHMFKVASIIGYGRFDGRGNTVWFCVLFAK